MSGPSSQPTTSTGVHVYHSRSRFNTETDCWLMCEHCVVGHCSVSKCHSGSSWGREARQLFARLRDGKEIERAPFRVNQNIVVHSGRRRFSSQLGHKENSRAINESHGPQPRQHKSLWIDFTIRVLLFLNLQHYWVCLVQLDPEREPLSKIDVFVFYAWDQISKLLTQHLKIGLENCRKQSSDS